MRRDEILKEAVFTGFAAYVAVLGWSVGGLWVRLLVVSMTVVLVAYLFMTAVVVVLRQRDRWPRTAWFLEETYRLNRSPTRCRDRDHRDRHGKPSTGARCPSCGERWTTPPLTLAYRFRAVRWALRASRRRSVPDSPHHTDREGPT